MKLVNILIHDLRVNDGFGFCCEFWASIVSDLKGMIGCPSFAEYLLKLLLFFILFILKGYYRVSTLFVELGF